MKIHFENFESIFLHLKFFFLISNTYHCVYLIFLNMIACLIFKKYFFFDELWFY
jgi:hypothetical protein